MFNAVKLSARADKQLAKCPPAVQRKLHGWVARVASVGVDETRKQPGYHDEPLAGDRTGQRSIRLSLLWRAIYVVRDGKAKFIEIIEVIPHTY